MFLKSVVWKYLEASTNNVRGSWREIQTRPLMELRGCEAVPSPAARSRGRGRAGRRGARQVPGDGAVRRSGGSVPQHMLLSFASGVMKLGNSITGRRRSWGAPGLCSREDGARLWPAGFSVCLSEQRWRRTSADLSGHNLISAAESR